MLGHLNSSYITTYSTTGIVTTLSWLQLQVAVIIEIYLARLAFSNKSHYPFINTLFER